MTDAALTAAIDEADRRASELDKARWLAEALAVYERMLAIASNGASILVQQGRAMLQGEDCERAFARRLCWARFRTRERALMLGGNVATRRLQVTNP